MSGDELLELVDDPELTQTLNELLSALQLPISLNDPEDLTPTLLLAVLESILRERLDIPSQLRSARDAKSKTEIMKIFLGVLQNDIVGHDLDVDPIRLCRGDRNEVVFIGEILCWLGGQYGLLQYRPSSPPMSSTTPTVVTTFGTFGRSTDEANTSFTTVTTAQTFNPLVTPLAVPNRTPNPVPQRQRPRCIHEVGREGFEDSSTLTANDGPAPPEVRYTGWISQVDEESELALHESMMHSLSASVGTTRSRIVEQDRSTQLESPTHRTMALLHERADLLDRLARLKL